MKAQDVPLAPDVLYVMDNALDEWSINPFTYATLSLYGGRGTVMEIVDRERPRNQGWLRGTGAMCNDLDEYAHALSVDLPDDLRRALFAATLIREPPKLDSLAECLAGWNIEDATLGGCQEDYRRGRDIRIDRDGAPTKKLRRKLAAPDAIRRYVRLTSKDTENIPAQRRQANRMRLQPWPADPGEALRLDAYFEAQRVRYHTAREERYREMMAEATARSAMLRRCDNPIWKVPAKDRKALRRAADTATALLGRAAVSAFVARRDPVIIRGESLNFSVSYAVSVRRQGHGALDICVLDMNDTRLCNLCLFWEDTPALDQLVALALHVRSGEELSLLAPGNPYNVTPAGAEHPLLRERMKRHNADLLRPESDADDLLHNLRRRTDIRSAIREHRLTGRDAQLLVTGNYVEKHKHLYIGPVTEAIWGRDAKRVRDFNERRAA